MNSKSYIDKKLQFYGSTTKLSKKSPTVSKHKAKKHNTYLRWKFISYEKPILNLDRAHEFVLWVAIKEIFWLWYAHTSRKELFSPFKNGPLLIIWDSPIEKSIY